MECAEPEHIIGASATEGIVENACTGTAEYDVSYCTTTTTMPIKHLSANSIKETNTR